MDEQEVVLTQENAEKALIEAPETTIHDGEYYSVAFPEIADNKIKVSYTQWTSDNGNMFFPAAKSSGNLPPGFYEVATSDLGLVFNRVALRTDGLIRIPNSETDKLLREIHTFWSREAIFKKVGMVFRRGVLLYGPPGSGKTSVARLLIRDVVSRGGVAFRFVRPDVFMAGLKAFRDVQPDTPVVVLMEDLDELLDSFNETQVINILDGVQVIQKVIFLATTNYPERLSARVANRPSRFDRRLEIKNPTFDARKIFLQALFDKFDVDFKMIDKWASDTENFSMAHLKELFISVVVFNNEYSEALNTLKAMFDVISSNEKKKDSCDSLLIDV